MFQRVLAAADYGFEVDDLDIKDDGRGIVGHDERFPGAGSGVVSQPFVLPDILSCHCVGVAPVIGHFPIGVSAFGL